MIWNIPFEFDDEPKPPPPPKRSGPTHKKNADFLAYIRKLSEHKSVGVFDNSALNVYMACPRKFLYNHELCIGKRQESAAITVGSAVHEFMSAMWKGKDFDECLLAMVGYFDNDEAYPIDPRIDQETIGKRGGQMYSIEWLISLMDIYFHRYQLIAEPFEILKDSDGDPYVEEGFAIDMEDGIFTGKIDAIVRDRNTGRLWVVDHKTTRLTLGDRFTMQFRPNNQLTGYMLAIRELFGEMPEGCIVNAIRVGQLKTLTVEQAYQKMFLRIRTYRTSGDLDSRIHQIRATMRDINALRAEGPNAYYQNAPTACNYYGGCGYKAMCMTSDADVMDAVVQTGFKFRDWSPLPKPSVYDHACELDGVTRFLV